MWLSLFCASTSTFSESFKQQLQVTICGVALNPRGHQYERLLYYRYIRIHMQKGFHTSLI